MEVLLGDDDPEFDPVQDMDKLAVDACLRWKQDGKDNDSMLSPNRGALFDSSLKSNIHNFHR